MNMPAVRSARSDVATIRAALKAAVEETSLRAVAQELSMSPTGLQGLLDGCEPYAKTRARIRAWYMSSRASELSDIPPETARAVIRALLTGVPESFQPHAQRRVLSAVAEAFEMARVEEPSWLKEIRDPKA